MDIQEKQELKQVFNKKYRELLYKIQKLEPTRKNIKSKRTSALIFSNIVFVICATLVTTLVIIIASSNNDSNIFGYISSFLGLLCGLFIMYVVIITPFLRDGYSKRFSELIKNECFNDLLEVFPFLKFGQDINYSIYDSGLFQDSISNKTKILLDDEFHGCYNNISFQITEISNAIIRGIKDVYSGPWRGVVLNLQFNKDSKTKIYLAPKSYSGVISMLCAGIFFGVLSLFLTIYIHEFISGLFMLIFSLFWIGLLVFGLIDSSKKTSKISFEDVVFEDKFYVECEDQVEARYILTPAFMEKLTNLKTVFNSKKLWFIIQGNRITMAFETNKDLFEIGNLNIPTTDPQQVESFFNEIMAITDIIDHFKLYE